MTARQATAHRWLGDLAWMLPDAPAKGYVVLDEKERIPSGVDGALVSGAARCNPGGIGLVARPLLLVRGPGRTRAVADRRVPARGVAYLLEPRAQPKRRLTVMAVRVAVPLAGRILRLVAVPATLYVREENQVLALVRDLNDPFIATRARDGRVHVRTITTRGTLSTVTKIIQDRVGRDDLAHEARVLQALNARANLAGTVPAVIAHRETGTAAALAVSAGRGQPCPLHVTAGIEQWLARLRSERAVPAADTALARETLGDAALRAEDPIRRAADAVRETLVGHRVPATIVHGDFAPWNIRVAGSVPFVFDWEYARLDGLPGWDRVFFDLQVGLVKHRWQAGRLTQRALALMSMDAMDNCPKVIRSAVVATVLIRMAINHEAAGNLAFASATMGALARLLEAGRINNQP